MLSEMSKPVSWSMPADKICMKLYRRDEQICDLRYGNFHRKFYFGAVNISSVFSIIKLDFDIWKCAVVNVVNYLQIYKVLYQQTSLFTVQRINAYRGPYYRKMAGCHTPVLCLKG